MTKPPTISPDPFVRKWQQAIGIALVIPSSAIGLYFFFWVMSLPMDGANYAIWQPWIAIMIGLIFMFMLGAYLLIAGKKEEI